jgi:hypothetical protein
MWATTQVPETVSPPLDGGRAMKTKAFIVCFAEIKQNLVFGELAAQAFGLDLRAEHTDRV